MNNMYTTATKNNPFKTFKGLNAVLKKLPVLLFLLVSLLIGGKSWATVYTASLSTSSTQFTSSPQTVAFSSVNWTLTNNGSFYGVSSTNGQQIGSAAFPATSMTFATSGISGTITSIVVTTNGAASVAATVGVTVGGSAFGGSAQSITATSAGYTFNGSASGAISVNWTQSSSKALYILSVQVTYTAGPSITLTSASQTGAANVYKGSTSSISTPTNVLYNFQAAVATATDVVSSVAVVTAGSYSSSTDVTNYKLYYNTVNTLSSASLLSTVATGVATGGTVTFSGLTQSITSGTTGYFWVLADIASSATAATTINIAATPTFTSSTSGATIASNTVTAGGTQTINNVTYTSATGADWNTASTWTVTPGGGTGVPAAGSTVIINHAVTIASITNNPATVTINSGGSLTTSAAMTITGAITVNSGGSLVVGGGQLTASGGVAVSGTFQINQSGYATGTFTWSGTTSTLIYNNTSGVYGPISGHSYWPISPTFVQPYNVSFTGAGGVDMGSTVHTITGTVTVSAAVTNSGSLTVNGTLQLNSGGSVGTSPTYGSSSTLVYNTGTTTGQEWTGGASTSVAATAGVPANVTVQSGTVTLGGGRGVPGNVTVNSTCGMILNSGAGDLYIAGNLTNNGSTWTNNSRAVFFVGTGTSVITNASGTQYFDYFIIQKTAGSVQLATSTNVTLNTTSGNVLQFLNAGTLDLNGNTLTLNNAGGNILVDGTAGGTAKSITSSSAATIAITNTKTASANASGTLSIGANITVVLTGGMNFGSGVTTINGTLKINSGGSVSTNAPAYGSGSLLLYNSNSAYGRGTEWTASSGTVGTTAGYPYNVQISTTTTGTSLNVPNGTSQPALGIANNLTVDASCAFYQDYGNPTTSNAVVVGGSVLNNGSISLGNQTGGDLKIAGNFTQNGTFTPNGRAIFFTGAASSVQTISASSSPVTIPYIVMGTAGNTVQLANTSILATAVNGGNAIDFGSSASNVFNLNAFNITIGTVGQTCNFTGSGFFKGNASSTMTIQGTTFTGNVGFVTTQQLSSLTVNLSSGGITLSSPLTTATLVMTTGSLSLNGNALGVTSALSGSGTIKNNHASTAATLTVSASGSNTFAGSLINGAAATLALTNSGTGTLTLSGANSYTGATTNSSSGTISISSTNTSAVTNSSTAKFAGTGSTTGAVNIASGTFISPAGSGSIGTLTTGGLTINGTYTFDINTLPGNGTAGTNWDYISCTTLTTTGFTLAITGTMPSFVAATNYQWKIGAYSSTLTASGTYTVNTAGLTGVTATGTFSVTISGGFIYLNYTAPLVTISSVSPAPSLVQNTTNNNIYTLVATSTGATNTITAISFYGTYSATTDFTNFKLYYNTTGTFSTGSLLGTVSSIPTSGSAITFSGLTQTVAVGTPGYFYLSTDIPCAAVTSNTITISAITTGNVTTTANLSGTASAGSALSIAAPTTPSNATSLAASAASGQSVITWVAPSGSSCEVMLVANTASTSATPSGNGSSYTANSLAFTDGLNTTFSTTGKVVYKGSGTTATITGLTNGTLYYYKLFTRNGNTWSTGTEVSQTPAIQYTTPPYTNLCSSGDIINSFSINTLSNLTSGCNGNANNYINYAATGSNTTTLYQGVTYSASVTIGSGGTGNVGIWIDYNDNGTFEASERSVNATLILSSGTQAISVAVASNATLGTHRMRVREVYSTSLAVVDPIASGGFGETEDYTITIAAPPSYYLAASSDPTVVANWSTNTNGSGGSHPSTMADAASWYPTYNSSTPTTAWANTWTPTGTINITGGNTFNIAGTLDLGTARQIVALAASATVSTTTVGYIKTSNANGFSGTTSTSISSTNSPIVTLNAASTVEYNGTSTQAVTTASSYGNLTFSGSGGIYSIATTGTFTLANGTLTLSNGTLTFNSSSSTSTIAIGGLYSQSGGTVNIATSTGTTTVNVNGSGTSTVSSGTLNLTSSSGPTSTLAFTSATGNFTQSGGTINLQNGYTSTGTPAANFTVGGNFSQSAGTFEFATSATTSTTATYVLNVAGSFARSGTSPAMQATGGGFFGNINFNGTTQSINITASSPTTSYIQYTISNGSVTTLSSNIKAGYVSILAGGTLNCGTNLVQDELTGTRNCTFTNSGTLGIGSTVGITAALTTYTGNIQATTARTFNTTANYTYNGSANQITGTGLPATVNNLTIANTGSTSNNVVTLSAATSVTSTLTLTSGILTTTATNIVTLTNTATSAISGGSSSTYVSGPVKWTLPASLASGSTYTFPIGTATAYLPYSLVNPTTGTGAVTAQVQAFSANPGGSTDATLYAKSSTEYWQLTTTGSFTNSSVSVTSPTAITPYNAVGTSATVTGTYTSLAGTAGTYAVTSSNTTSTGRFFVLAQSPVITAGTLSPTSVSTTYGTASSNMSFTLNGTGLTANVVVTPPAGFEVSQTSGGGSGFAATQTLTPTSGTVSSITIYVRLAATTNAGTYSGNITCVSTNATTQNVAISTSTVNKGTSTLSISNSPVTYSGSAQSATVSGTGGGVVSNILYNGSSTVPTNAGTYTVVADIAASTNYNAATGASAGSFVINMTTPTLSISNSPVTYSGSAQSAIVSGTGGGVVSNILYNGSSTIPTNAGTYTVVADIASSTNYNAATGVSAGSFVINKTTPTLSISNSPVTYSGSAQSATVSGTGGGVVSNILYNGSSTVPTNAGTYTVVADIAASTNYNAASGASAGSFVINKGTSTLSISNSPVTYSGSAQSATVSGTGGGVVSNILYNGSSTVPTNAGTYTVVADIAASTNYNAATGASAGSFVINKASSTITATGTTSYTYTGLPQGPATNTETGSTGAITYSYSGTGGTTYAASATKPTLIGTYQVIATVAADANYNTASSSALAFSINAGTPGLWLGTYSINYSDYQNWADGVVPSGVNVTIPGGTTYSPTVAGTSGTSTIYLTGSTLTINGSISSGTTFNSSPTSSLVIGSAAAGSTITFAGTTDSVTNGIANLTINGGVTLGSTIHVYGLVTVGTGITFNVNHQHLVLHSDAAYGTAAVGPVNDGSHGTISNADNVTVQRYHANKRAWMLMSAPLTMSGITRTSNFNGSIYNNWQKQTYITAPSAYTSNGLDAATNTTYGMLRWIGTGWGRVLNTLNDTSLIGNHGGTLADNNPFFLFVRGDRSVTPTTGGTSSTYVTLEASGGFQSGTKTFSFSNTSSYALVANPYPAPIDLASFIGDNTGLNTGGNVYFYYWDPNNSTTGGYTTAIYNNGFWSYSARNTSNSLALAHYIQSGQAFFVTTNGQSSVTFNETQKSTGSSTNAVFGNSSTASINVDLSKGATYIDGAMTMYNNNYNAAVIAPAEDAYKFWGNEEGVAIARTATNLSVEARPEITGADTSFLYMNKMIAGTTYTFNISANNMPTNVTGVLVDKYLNKSTALDLTASTNINFTVDTAAAAKSATRFMIVYNAKAPLYVSDIKIKASVKAKAAVIDWTVSTEKDVKSYTVEHSISAADFKAINTTAAKNANNSNYSYTDNSATTGDNYYRIKAINTDGSVQYSSIAKVTIGDRKEGMSIYPNPIVGKTMNVQLSNIAEGTYSLNMINANGQQVMEQQLQHAGGSVTSTVQLPAAIASGIYQLILTSNGKSYVETVVVK